MSETEDVKLYNPNDGVTGRDDGVYLDLEEAKAREARSARLEKRKPDYNVVQATGIPLVTESTLRDRNYIPEPTLIEGKVQEKVEKHFKDGDIAEVKVTTDEGFRTSTAKEEKEFLEQGKENREEQGKNGPGVNSDAGANDPTNSDDDPLKSNDSNKTTNSNKSTSDTKKSTSK